MPWSSCYVLCLLLYLVTCSQPGLKLSQVNDWADDISSRITRMWEDLSGHQHLKQAYQESLTKVAIVNTTQLLEESAQKMEQYFCKKIDSLQRIKERATTAYAERKNAMVTTDAVKYVKMSDLNTSSIPITLQFDKRFQQNISTSHSGIQIPTNVYDEGAEVLKTINWTSQLEEVFIDNFKNKDETLKWQYFGSRDAVFRTYPAKRWTSPYYSARRRPWYTQGATSPKSMVILVDSSGSMVGKASVIGRLAVSNLIDTLSENDFFNVIYFNTAVYSLSCNKTLVQATKANRESFKSKLRKGGYKNVAMWETALKEAFETLQKVDGAECQKMIMIFSDGTERHYEDVFERYNKNQEVRVFTYHLGNPSHSSEDHLTWMACSNKGYFYKVPTVGAVRDLIEDYVSVLSRPMANTKNESVKPVWTGIYRDASGLGMMVTVTLPVFHEGTFLGVCGTDVTISELENFVYQPYIGADGYAFIINNNGHIVKHPNLRAMFGYVKGDGDVDVTMAELVPDEQIDNVRTLRKRMLEIEDHETGKETFKGFSFTEYERYLRITPVERTYIFKRIKQTPFSLGIASPAFGYEVQESQPYLVANESLEKNGTVFLEDWQHCNSTTLSLEQTVLRRELLERGCNDNLLLDLNITQNVWLKNFSRGNISAAFVKTNWGLLRMSQSNGSNIVGEKVFERIKNVNEDSIVVSVQYNGGGKSREVTSTNLLVYKGIHIVVSNLSITPVVSGFQVEEENFLKDYLMHVSSKDKYHIYLLDENAFIVSSSINCSKNVCGQFFGSVDWELMSELEKGQEPLYTSYTLRNEQGICAKLSSGRSSSSFNYPFYSALASSFTSWAKTILAFLLHTSLYNLMFAEATTSTATPKVEVQTNRSCVTNMTAYYGNASRWKSFSGNTSCLDCEDSNEMRQYFVAPVRGTNLVLVVVEYFAEKAIFHYTKKSDNIPGKHREIEIHDGECIAYSEPARRSPERCVLSQDEETQYSCGRAGILGANILFIVFNILYSVTELER